MPVKPIPEGYHSITPYLMIKDAPNFIEFLKKAFNAKQVSKSEGKDGKLMHAEIKIGDSMIMLTEASEKYPSSAQYFYLYVPDTDAAYKQAIGAGAVSEMEPANQFYGDRSAGVKDSFGITWWIATHVEDVSPEEMKKREEEYMKKK
ncbi:MAG: VOC family protein [Bacteroidota bacterium]|nr:VOC family protein [Bacteroidota bacterium]